jgi:hypothetical protein
MNMEEPHAHMGESTESLSALSLSVLLQVLHQLCESLRFRFIVNSVFFRRSRSTPSSANRRLHSVSQDPPPPPLSGLRIAIILLESALSTWINPSGCTPHQNNHLRPGQYHSGSTLSALIITT